MDKKFSDEQVDRIAKALLKDFAADDATLDEIAASPKLWWGVKNRIEAEKTRREKRWFAFLPLPAFAFGALALLLCAGFGFLLLSSKNQPDAPLAKDNSAPKIAVEPVRPPAESKAVSPSDEAVKPTISNNVNPVPRRVSAKNTAPKAAKFAAADQNRADAVKSRRETPKKEIPAESAVAETKTDFIALSYAANTDSGQIVRVKVPSSMMVSLGVATNVDKESAMVSAEVIIGDDGLARAIRFIR
ncbi:MAG: hypothetical protein JSS81_04915 [Acidobacteria bacterium]|nr:hypothetical protein [Acidobacteriota bacterium]